MNNMFKKSSLCGLLFLASLFIYGNNIESELYKINIEWYSRDVIGSFNIVNGDIERIVIAKGEGRINVNEFQFADSKTVRLSSSITLTEFYLD